MKIQTKDLVIVQVTDKRKALVTVTQDNDGDFVGFEHDDGVRNKETRSVLEFNADDVIANLGRKPQVGSTAYGKRIEPFVSSEKMPMLGTVAFFRSLEEGEIAAIRKGLARVLAKLQDLKLINMLNLEVNIYPKRGSKYAGSYTYKGGDAVDVLALFPKDFSDLNYLLWHEFGHYIWFRYLSEKLKARWVNAFRKSIDVSRQGDAQLKRMLKDLQKSDEPTCKDFRKQLDPESAELFDEVLGFISSYHNLSAKHIDILRGNDFDISEYWPELVNLQNLTPIISEYATKNPEELFAETIGFIFTKKEVPASLTKLWNKTYDALPKDGKVAKTSTKDDDEDDAAETEAARKRKAKRAGKAIKLR